eukprot:13277019-Alexandrium_andersonii.AAC.1
MGEVAGPWQALVMQFFLPVVSQAVGLRIDTHLCLGARVVADETSVGRRLSALPARVQCSEQ